MKKLIIMLAAVAAAVAVNAASVDWNYQITGDAGGSATEFTGYTAYLVDAAYYDSLGGAVTADAITSSGNYIQSAALTQTGSSGKGASKKYVFSTGAQELASDSLVEGTTYNYYLVLVDAAGDTYYAQAYNYTARNSAGSPSADDIKFPKDGSAVTSGMTAWSGGSPSGDGPEPTSGLLLLVGVGILGLRRKRA